MPTMKTRARIAVGFALLVMLAARGFAEDAPAFSAGTGILSETRKPAMSVIQAAVLGIVEGTTEFLPVSSTGHLLVLQRLMRLMATPQEKTASDAYAICIQLGAILAVLAVSFGRIKGMVRGIFGRDRDGLRLLGNLVVAFVPAAIIGLFLEPKIKHLLFSAWYVAAAWLVGGIFILAVLARRSQAGGGGLESLSWRTALLIGLAQVAALWPGVSRSLVTIAGGLFVGLSVSAAVEFSFLLGLVTLGAATVYEGLTLGPEIVRTFGWVSPAVGLVVAAAAAFLAVKWMVAYLRTRSLAVFGWYRIGIAVVAGAFLLAGVL